MYTVWVCFFQFSIDIPLCKINAMFKLGLSVCTLFILQSFKSQQVDWEHINSNNALAAIAIQNNGSDAFYSNIIQVGDFNKAALSLNEKTDISVRQLGDYNTLFFINSFTDTETKTAVTTQGNNNIIDITGSNSVSDGMQVTVKGDNKTVFMRNY